MKNGHPSGVVAVNAAGWQQRVVAIAVTAHDSAEQQLKEQPGLQVVLEA
jgi:hypothetical protein